MVRGLGMEMVGRKLGVVPTSWMGGLMGVRAVVEHDDMQ